MVSNLTPSIEKALILMGSVRAEIKNGVRHYDIDGKLLETSKEVIIALAEDGHVMVDASNRVEIVLIEEEIELVRKEYAEKIQ